MKKLLSILFLMFHLIGNAQDTLPEQLQFSGNILLTGKYYEDSIVLRWAPNTAGAWHNLNISGYNIERTALLPDSTFNPALFTKINEQSLKPWPLNDWEKIAKDTMAAIAAQAIYGKRFSTGHAGIVDQSDEFTTRWSFTLLASDISAQAATAAGLRFVDENIERNKVYVYRILPANKLENYSVDTGYFVINTDEVVNIPNPSIKKVEEGEYKIQISWDRHAHSGTFSAYFIERSDDKGKTFKRLNRLPYINPTSEKLKDDRKDIIYIDSVKENYRPYHYRLIGVNAFGEISQPSEAVVAIGRDKTPPNPPVNVKAESKGKGEVTISWEMIDPAKDLQGFFVGRSHNAMKDFQPLFEKPLSPKTRSYTDKPADPSKPNYYIVAAVDTAGNGAVSLIQYGMIVDSLPPASPKGLTGKVDTNGIVSLTWRLGPEKDIAGYQVYFSNHPDHVFTHLTNKPLADTSYTDTIVIKTLTEKIYYKIVAVDVNYNYSDFSEVLELKRPDLIPPSPPLFTGYKVEKDGISLTFTPSSSEDVAQHILWRKTPGTEWQQIFLFTKTSSYNYVDKNLEAGNYYVYTLQAIDDDSLKSSLSYPLRLQYIDKNLNPPIRNLTANLDKKSNTIKLSWSYPYEGSYRYVIYRAMDGGGFVSIKSIEQGNNFTDHMVKKGRTYDYVIKVIYPDGKESGFSNVAKVGIK